MPVRLLVIAEADADRRMVCGLVDRKIVRHAPAWFDHGAVAPELDALRTWCGLESGTLFTPWIALKKMTTGANLGGFRGVAALGRPRPEARGYDYETVRKALILCARMEPTPDVVLIVRDLDRGDLKERRDSIERARQDGPTQPPVLLAMPLPKREAWLLNGFSPNTDKEESLLANLRAELGCHPCAEAHRLTAETHGAKKDIKRVFNEINEGDDMRIERRWEEASWDTLRTRGLESGLTSFLEEVKTRLLQKVIGQPVS